ncbi:hypothetical protein AYI69_g8306, partial [Smittium culicis]
MLKNSVKKIEKLRQKSQKKIQKNEKIDQKSTKKKQKWLVLNVSELKSDTVKEHLINSSIIPSHLYTVEKIRQRDGGWRHEIVPKSGAFSGFSAQEIKIAEKALNAKIRRDKNKKLRNQNPLDRKKFIFSNTLQNTANPTLDAFERQKASKKHCPGHDNLKVMTYNIRSIKN